MISGESPDAQFASVTQAHSVGGIEKKKEKERKRKSNVLVMQELLCALTVTASRFKFV